MFSDVYLFLTVKEIDFISVLFMVISVANVRMYVCPGQYIPWAGSRQGSFNYLIWFTLLCYLLCSGDKI